MGMEMQVTFCDWVWAATWLACVILMLAELVVLIIKVIRRE